MIEQANDMDNKPTKFIEMKLPLVWLLSSVAIRPGAMQFTVTPDLETSSASVRDMPISPAFVAE